MESEMEFTLNESGERAGGDYPAAEKVNVKCLIQQFELKSSSSASSSSSSISAFDKSDFLVSYFGAKSSSVCSISEPGEKKLVETKESCEIQISEIPSERIPGLKCEYSQSCSSSFNFDEIQVRKCVIPPGLDPVPKELIQSFGEIPDFYFPELPQEEELPDYVQDFFAKKERERLEAARLKQPCWKAWIPDSVRGCIGMKKKPRRISPNNPNPPLVRRSRLMHFQKKVKPPSPMRILRFPEVFHGFRWKTESMPELTRTTIPIPDWSYRSQSQIMFKEIPREPRRCIFNSDLPECAKIHRKGT